jgi:hypothetical protein
VCSDRTHHSFSVNEVPRKVTGLCETFVVVCGLCVNVWVCGVCVCGVCGVCVVCVCGVCVVCVVCVCCVVCVWFVCVVCVCVVCVCGLCVCGLCVCGVCVCGGVCIASKSSVQKMDTLWDYERRNLIMVTIQ